MYRETLAPIMKVESAGIVVLYPPPPSVAAMGTGLNDVSHAVCAVRVEVVDQTNLLLPSVGYIPIETEPSDITPWFPLGATGRVTNLILHW
jgi:hypothetical protein